MELSKNKEKYQKKNMAYLEFDFRVLKIYF